MKFASNYVAVAVCCLMGANWVSAQEAVLYDFTASWCGPCQQMNPIVHKLTREGFPVEQVDIDRNPELARKYNISSIPAFVMVVNGQEVDRYVGRTTEAHLRQMLAKVPRGSGSPGNVSSGNPAAGGGRSSLGFDQPRLGAPEPFPMNDSTGSNRSAPENLANTATPDYRIRNLAGQNNASAQPTLGSNSGQNSPANSIIRAQFDENNNITKPTPHIDSRAANVRIRIRDDKGINYGSGTIIESRPGITYVLTCGHIFRNIAANSKVDVDIFTADRFESFVGKVEKYDLDADVGLVSLPTDGVLPVAKLARAGVPLKAGAKVISVGCSGGQNPTVEELEVTALNRYTGPDNIECTGIPVQGRSGGGLFNEDNEVVGVCIAADPKEKRGLYAGLTPILELVESCGLSQIIRRSQPEEATVVADAGQPEAFPGEMPTQNFPGPAGGTQEGAGSPFGAPPVGQSAQASPPPEQVAQMLQALQASTGAKLTIVIENPAAPGQTQVVIIPAATPRLIADLTGELNATQTVAAHRKVAEQQKQQPQIFSSIPTLTHMAPPARQLREEDRSVTLPTDFSVAEPYRRIRK